MGNFRIVIDAVGGHGVDRDKKDGEKVDFFVDGRMTPDAIAKFATLLLQNSGCGEVKATLTHWPETDSQVVDDLVTGERKGNF